jgi:F-type H+-transporting ATPase subunit b
LVRIEPALVFVQVLTFAFAVFLLWRFFWKPLARFMDGRAHGIERDLAEAKQQRAEAEALYRQMRERLSEVDERAEALIALATEEGQKNRARILAEAQEEARRIIDGARRQLAEEEERARRELRAETVALAMLIAEKAMRQSVDPKLQQRLVDDFVREMQHDS